MNFFGYESVAKRYAEGRPHFHPIVVEMIREITGVDRFEHAIDVGCGTGQSARALKAIAGTITGIDVSRDMIAQAPLDPRIVYKVCPAEAMDVPDAGFDLMTVSLVFHWLDRERFLVEARRVLEPRAWMVIYQNVFFGMMRGTPEFETWNRSRYLKRYPTPPRDASPFDPEMAERFGFRIETEEKYENAVSMNRIQLALYLSTQSNMIAAIESGNETVEDALQWLTAELETLFRSEQETMRFGGWVLFLRKV